MSKIRYKSSKTNGFETYDSYADFNLVTALVNSLHDSDMQQWQAVKDAIGELTGVSSWTFDNVDKVVRYVTVDTGIQPSDQYYYEMAGGVKATTPQEACMEFNEKNGTSYHSANNTTCYYNSGGNRATLATIYKVSNPDYDPNYVAPTVSITYQQVVDKIIANSNVADQAISLLAEAYVETITQSIFNQDESKQFVKLSDLISQFELNKTLRT